MIVRSKLPKPRIVIDTREQKPLSFDGYETIEKKLDTGDYALEGYEHLWVVERKSKEDAYQCVGASRKRFIECLERLEKFDRASIVIECTFEEFKLPPEKTKIDQRMAAGSMISWMVKHNIHIFWAYSRYDAARFTSRFLISCLKWRNLPQQLKNTHTS